MKRIFLTHLHLKEKREKKRKKYFLLVSNHSIVKLILIASILDVSYLAKFHEENLKENEENFSCASPQKKKKKRIFSSPFKSFDNKIDINYFDRFSLYYT